MKKCLIKPFSFLLAIVMCVSILPLQVFAEGGPVSYLPEMTIEDEILESDVFYVAASSAVLEESSDQTYLLRVARGGVAANASDVHIKIADVTAKYGKDYIVRVHDTGDAADSPRDNLSLMEMMEGETFTQSALGTEEDLASMLENDEEGQAVLDEGVQSAIDFLDEESGLSDKYADGYPLSETEPLDEVQQARAAFTGVQAASQRLTAQSDMFDDLQSVADVLTSVVPGADITLRFAPGESVKYLELIPRNNDAADGSRLFYVVLSEPQGGTTVSSASSCAVTIVDDEVQEPSVVSFSAAEYDLVPGEESVTVALERTGALNTVVSVTIRTTGEGSAEIGRDYSEVDREMLFPFGVSRLTVDIPVRTDYFSGEKDFKLALTAGTACSVGMDSTTVRLTGTYAPEVSLLSASDPSLASETTDRNSLSTVRVLDPIDISQPASSGHQNNYYGGNNHYESNNKRWLLEWMDSSIIRDRKGTLGAIWQISPDEGRYWIAGTQVVWERTGDCAEITVAIDGTGSLQSFFTNWQARGDNFDADDLYKSTASFGKETINMYPTESNIRDYYGFSPKWLCVYNRGRCDDCNRLWIYSVRPILRPFQIKLKQAQPMDFLQPDGSYAPDDGTATEATIVNNGNQIVCFLDNGFTVAQLSGSNMQQYTKLTKLSLVNESGKAIYTLGKNSDAAVKEISYTLSKEALTSLKKSIGTAEFRNMIKENEFASGKTVGYANYGAMNVQPSFDYIDSTVTLLNPYDFPVTMVISGTTYTLAAKASQELSFHLGDQLALTEVRPVGDAASVYSAVGATVLSKRTGAEVQSSSETLNFVDQDALYLGGSNTGDHRLCCRYLTVKPELQEKGNRIIVRVKTSELSLFDTGESAGLLHQAGTVNGEYTEFLMANADHTFNGKLYAVSAMPADSGYTCLWFDKNTNRYYEGNTLYYTAGDDPVSNIITLTAIPAGKSLTLSGTLRYMNYNLRTRDAGSVSAVPASGAVVAAGSVSAAAAEDGSFRTGEMPVSGVSGHYLRYLISVNGTALVQEAVLPAAGGNLDISGNLPDGVSPVTSDIFSGIRITAKYPESSGYSVEDSTYLPIVSGVAVTLNVDIRPTDYTVTTTSEIGTAEHKLTEHPQSVILAVYDSAGLLKGKYESADFEYDDFYNMYSVSVPVDFSVSTDDSGVFDDEGGAGGEEEGGAGGEDASGSFNVLPGDKLYLRLTTDRLAQAGEGGEDYGYTYSDIYTGFTFIAPDTYEAPVVQGLESPVNIGYDNLPLIGTAGMNLDFPFVSVGWTKIARGYRMYIGVSAAQIYDAVKDTHISSFAGDNGVYWNSLFKLKDPFQSFANGMSTAYKYVKEGIGKGCVSTGSLGSPQWRFDLQFGAYFDFYNPTVMGMGTDINDGFYFAGVGFYMSATLGFKIAWYFVIPVVFIPAYIGIELQGSIMGFLGAAASGKATVSMDMARNQSVDFDDDLDEFSGTVRGVGTAQLSIGVGLCGTLGLRVVGSVRLIGEYAPSDIVRDWGVYVGIYAGITIDLFLFSIPLVFQLAHTAFGSFEDYESGVYDPANALKSPTLASAQADPFLLREGSGKQSAWRGDSDSSYGALSPAFNRVLVMNAYEHADSQLITLDNGTVVLAYIDSDLEKGPYQRTTLMLASYFYDEETLQWRWSDAVPVCEDDTADFQPSIGETRDGRVLVSWVSTGANDVTDETSTADYLRSMEVYAAFATVGAKGSITVDAPTQLTTGTREEFYDSNPTVVCDKISGDAIVYYVKSGSTTENAAELANPYTNDCVVCYMYYNAEADLDVNEQTVPAGWLTENYYYGEYSGPTPDFEQWGGQRFLNGPTFENAAGDTIAYTIPDFTAIGYNGLAVFSYTVDKDGSNDTTNDKELYLQVFNFEQHELKYLIQLTEDGVSDTLPQFFRSRQAGISTDEEQTHTKLFWYRDGKDVCYIDVTRLIQEGINADGSFVANDEDYTDESGVLRSHYTEPHYVGSSASGSAAGQMADFRVAEDCNGSLYVVWTESVTDPETEQPTSQIFAVGLYMTSDDYSDEDSNANKTGSTCWSHPYQLTDDIYCSDGLAATTCAEGLLVVHNRFIQTLEITGDATRFEGIVDYDPIKISNMRLIATVLAPCGSTVAENITFTYAEDAADDENAGDPHFLPEGGRDVQVTVHVTNQGLTEAKGYKLTLYAEQDGTSTKLDTIEVSDPLLPTYSELYHFSYTLPDNPEGLVFRADTQERRPDGAYYTRSTYRTDPLECRANYILSNVETCQSADGFLMHYTLTNNGNAVGTDDTLRLRLSGPFNIERNFDEAECLLYTGSIGTLGIGESRDYDVTVKIPTKMLEKYGFVDATAVIVREAEDGTEMKLSDPTTVAFDLTGPMNMTVGNVQVAVNSTGSPLVSMDLARLFGGEDVDLAVEDLTVAAVQDGQIIGLNPGTTTLYATHAATGMVVSSTVTVYDDVVPETPEKVKKLTDFEDLDTYAWYSEGVSYALEKGIMDGMSETIFAPDEETTRAMVVTMLWRLAGEPTTTEKMSFTDVPENQWYTEAIRWASANGVVNGFSAERFAPNDLVTREQLVAILCRYARAKGMNVSVSGADPLQSFVDADTVSPWAADSLRWAVNAGIINGTGKNFLSPGANALRAQVSTIFMRFDKINMD